jgi:DNA-binding XRE family transcriptional regulator
MARKGKSTQEIIGFLREAEVRIAQGETAGKVCRGAGISEQTYYTIKSGRTRLPFLRTPGWALRISFASTCILRTRTD